MTPPRILCLDAAREAVMARADAYGTPEALFARIAARWSLTLSTRLTEPLAARDVALLMLDMKQERAIAGGSPDTWTDMAGYSACGAEIDASGPLARRSEALP